MFSHKGQHRRPSKTGTAVTAAGTGLAATAIIASASAASASTLPAPSSSHQAPLRAVADTIRAAQPLTVTVQPGDSLSKIAKDHCGNPAMWTGIYTANKPRIADYNVIYPGQRFTIACKISHVPQAVVVETVAYAPRHSAVRQAPVQARAESNVSTAGMGGFQACVIRAESGGNSQIWNASGHYGLYQFSASTWAGHGGNPADFGRASAAEQTQVFWNTVHDDGTSDWAPYDGC